MKDWIRWLGLIRWLLLLSCKPIGREEKETWNTPSFFVWEEKREKELWKPEIASRMWPADRFSGRQPARRVSFSYQQPLHFYLNFFYCLCHIPLILQTAHIIVFFLRNKCCFLNLFIFLLIIIFFLYHYSPHNSPSKTSKLMIEWKYTAKDGEEGCKTGEGWTQGTMVTVQVLIFFLFIHFLHLKYSPMASLSWDSLP